MPEGDTVHKIALRFRESLLGQKIEEAAVRQHGSILALRGAQVRGIDAIGKHMLVHFGDGTTLRVHLGMKGRWRRYSRGECHLTRQRSASVFLATPELEVACYQASQTELTRTRDLGRNRALSYVGPDLLARELDLATILARARSSGERPVGELVLDQWVASGIGNVYKSEVLFMLGIDPWAETGALGDDQLARIYRLARKLLHQNVQGSGRRVTVDPGALRAVNTAAIPRLWVYDRAGQPCLDCGAEIASRGQGELDRTTYYCRHCQLGPGNRDEPLLQLR